MRVFPYIDLTKKNRPKQPQQKPVLAGGWSTRLKNMCKSNWIISPRFGVKIKHVWKHHLDVGLMIVAYFHSQITISHQCSTNNQPNPPLRKNIKHAIFFFGKYVYRLFLNVWEFSQNSRLHKKKNVRRGTTKNSTNAWRSKGETLDTWIPLKD